ncbi:MAG: arylamine N-acetyltransferase [Chloroflexi bacterium]|nr:arylamine N-acetyltransferase [Chloroflexota bacterium]
MERSEIVQKYLQQLDLHGRSLDLNFLKKINTRHVATFSFSSLGCRLGNELPLDIESLYQRIVVQRRGGYCFEQNGLMYEILEELGFKVRLYLARVIYNQDIHPGLTHRITMVEFDGKDYILDVGFGADGPRIPISMSGKEIKDGDRKFRISEPRAGEFHMQIFQDGNFFSLYRFELARYGQSDCELGHFYSHKHPKAGFVNHLVISRILDNEIRSLRNLAYWIIKKSGTQEEIISTAEDFRQILIDELNIRVAEAESLKLYEQAKTISLEI